MQEGYVHNSFTGIVNQVEVPFRNQGTGKSSVIVVTTKNLPPQQNTCKRGKKKSSQRDQHKTLPQPSTSNGSTNTA